MGDQISEVVISLTTNPQDVLMDANFSNVIGQIDLYDYVMTSGGALPDAVFVKLGDLNFYPAFQSAPLNTSTAATSNHLVIFPGSTGAKNPIVVGDKKRTACTQLHCEVLDATGALVTFTRLVIRLRIYGRPEDRAADLRALLSGLRLRI